MGLVWIPRPSPIVELVSDDKLNEKQTRWDTRAQSKSKEGEQREKIAIHLQQTIEEWSLSCGPEGGWLGSVSRGDSYGQKLGGSWPLCQVSDKTYGTSPKCTQNGG